MPNWYAVHTRAQEEWLANGSIRELGLETLLLHRLVERRHARRVAVRRMPEFPRYVFARAGEDRVWAINRARGVSTVVFANGKPLIIPDAVIAELRARGDDKGEIRTPPVVERERLKAGERVQVVDGPFAGLLAIVALDAGPQVRIWLDLFGGKVEALADPTGLKQLHPTSGVLSFR